jgi:hypothetical protein
MGFFGDKHVFLQLSRIVLCGANRAYVAFETTRLEESFLGNRTQFSKGNKVLDAPISDTHDFLQEFHLSLQLSWMGLLETKWAFHLLHKYDLQELFLSKTNSTLRGKQCATCYYFYYTCVCSRDTCVSSTQLNRPIWNKESLSPPWNTVAAGSIPFKK